MEKVQIMGKLIITQIVTDGYKERAGAEFQEAAQKLEVELATFDKEMQKTITELTLKAHPQVDQVRRQFNMEREKIAVYKDQLTSSLKEIIDLPIGSEVPHAEGNFLEELKVGDHFSKGSTKEIVVKDDIIVEIRG